MKKKHEVSTFSLSFLDVMCCGFGAVVLLVMLLNGQTLQKREDTQQNLQAKIERMTQLKEFASDHMEELRRQVTATELEEADLLVQAEQIRGSIDEEQHENERAAQAARKREEEIQAMQKEIAALEREREKQKELAKQSTKSDGKRVGFDGEGQRQYLTGLKLGGDRTLILVDASASMLEETIVNIIRYKLMNESIRRRSPKWQRAVRSVHWLVANLPPEKSFQVFYFNTQAKAAIPGTEKRWLSTSDTKHLDGAIAAIRRLAPIGGTNLIEAFDVIRTLEPKPDSVLLLTDGLPTQGRSRQIPNTVSGQERLSLFNHAISSLPEDVPINTLLFPIEGDPYAAAAFWGLAIDTRGSFITPSRDWP